MKAAGIHSQRKRAYKATTNSRHNCPIAPNLLQRQFTFSRPNQAWLGDITYIPTGEGWLYFAIVKDLCTKKIVGYAFSQRIDTQLTLDALNMAVRRERPAPGLIFHSDRGVQYAAAAFRERLASLGVRQSMSCLLYTSHWENCPSFTATQPRARPPWPCGSRRPAAGARPFPAEKITNPLPFSTRPPRTV